MIVIMAYVLILGSAAMATFSIHAGYVPVSRPIYRVYRDRRPAYFWTLIGGYALVVALSLFALTR